MRKTLDIVDILNGIKFDINGAIEDIDYGQFSYANLRLNVASKRLDALDTLMDREQKTYYGIKTIRTDLNYIRELVKKAEFLAKMNTDDESEVA